MEIKRQALQLYLEGLGFRAIGRLLGVSNVAVLNGSGCLARKSSAPCSGRPQTRPAAPHDHAGRDVALHPRQKNKCRLWISLCYFTGRILGVHMGGRGAGDLRDFPAAFPEAKGQIAFTDDLAAYAAMLPEGAFRRENADPETRKPQRERPPSSRTLRSTNPMHYKMHAYGIPLRASVHG